jgi:polyhydroxyalkanoate synthase subunit PhaE
MTTQTWNELTNEMVNTWTETGTKMWKSWFDLMTAVPPVNLTQNGQENPVTEVAQRFFDNRELMVKFLKISVDAWQDLFPKIENGANWQEVLNKYTEQMRQQLSSFSKGYINNTQDTAKLWNLYVEQTQKVSQIWLNPANFSMETMTQALTGNPNALIEINHLYWKLLYEDTFGNLLQSPLLGPTREFNSKLVGGFEAWRELYKASGDYQIILADIQVKSFEALMKKLVEMAEKGKQVANWKEFQTIWSQVSDDVFEQAFCQEDNLKIRGSFLNALNGYRIKQQELMEISMKMMNMPLRSEVDEMHKTIYELKKEVKGLKKTLVQYEEKLTELTAKIPSATPPKAPPSAPSSSK